MDRRAFRPMLVGVVVGGAALLWAFQCAQVGGGQAADAVLADGDALGSRKSAHIERGGEGVR